MSKGASVYLTQQEMKIILEALDMLETDYEECGALKEIAEASETARAKILPKWKP